MPWSYNPSELATNEVYQVRAELQDTDPRDQQLQDEEIAYALTQERNFWAGCARCAEMIGRRVLRKADVRLGRSMQVQYTKMAQGWFTMARMLRSKAMGTVVPYIGGMTAADKMTIGQDSGLIAPMFTKNMMENPWVGGYTTDTLPDTVEGESLVLDEEVF